MPRFAEMQIHGLGIELNTIYVSNDPLRFTDIGGLTKGGKQKIACEGFTRNSNREDVKKALDAAMKKGKEGKRSANALRGLLKVIRRGGR